MIVFELTCAARHRFEGWFASSEDFNAQHGRRLIACPQCGNDRVEKLPSAKIRTTDAAAPSQSAPEGAGPPASMDEFVNHVLRNTEDVGAKFAEEARRIQREEAPKRDIRGVATIKDTKALLDEGISVFPLPIPPKGEWH
jgi:hypothetical protein